MIVSYLKLIIQQLRIAFSNQSKLQIRVQNQKAIPSKLGIIIDDYNPKIDKKIIETVDFISDIPQIEYIAVYFTCTTTSTKFKSKKVTVLTSKQNDTSFLEAMKSQKPLDDFPYPFPSRLDLAIFFSKYPHLCNFFTWTLDLTTLYFAGPTCNISPVTILDSFDSFGRAEQRCGK